MATSKTRIKLKLSKVRKDLLDKLTKDQTDRLIKYATDELNNMVESKEFHNRTGHAQDSYVWLVCHNGRKTAHGYYGAKQASGKSYLHEWSPEIRQKVEGRKAATAFVKSYKPTITKGWEIVWCAAAPYLGYHDKNANGDGGFTLHGKKYQFNVMSQRYDEIKRTLEPKCKVRFEVNPPQY